MFIIKTQFLLVCLLAGLIQVNASGEPDKKEVFMGEHFQIELPLEASPAISSIESPVWYAQIFDYSLNNGNILVTAAVYDIGEMTVPVIARLGEGDNAEEFNIGEFSIKAKEIVKEKVTENTSIRPIKNVVKINDVDSRWILGLTFILALFTIIYLREKRKREKRALEKKPLTIMDRALLRLREIKEADYPSRGEYKVYYDAISDCVRMYIEKRYDVPVLSLTLYEATNMLKIRYNEEIYGRSRHMFEECDWIKFTPEGMEPSNIESVWNQAYNLIKNDL
ncbi:MAG: hypothetical protein ABIH89_01900 [Elusimicrobiota bacterium]